MGKYSGTQAAGASRTSAFCCGGCGEHGSKYPDHIYLFTRDNMKQQHKNCH